MTALALVMLLGVSALAVDIGYMYEMRNRMSAAADAAARSAAMAIKSTGCACNAACTARDNFAGDAVERMGFSRSDLIVNHAPLSGPFTGDCSYVEAIVRRTAVPTFFGRVLGSNSMSVAARAVAGGANEPPCMVTLKPGVNGIAHTAGTVSMPGCEIQDNGNMSETGVLFDVRGTGGGPNGFIRVSGTCASCDSTNVLPFANLSLSTGQTYPDPFASIEPPWDSATLPAGDPCTTGGTVNVTQKTDSRGHTYTLRSLTRWSTTGVTLQPGIYCGGIGVGLSGTTTTAAGIYILYGAPGSHSSFQANGGGTLNATTPPPEVMFYATGAPATSSSAWKFPDHNMLDFNPSGGGIINLKATRSGPWKGILFFQDRTWASGTNSQVTGGGSTNLEGYIYIANLSSTNPTLRFSGGTGAGWVDYTKMIVPSMTFTGGSTLNNRVSVFPGSGSGMETKIAE